MPFDNDTFPLPELGQLVEISEPARTSRGTVSSVRLAVQVDQKGAVQIHQTVGFGDGNENVWSAFQKLTTRPPLLVGTIITANSDGTVTVQYSSGGTERVLGSGSAGDKVYVRAGRVEGVAPTCRTPRSKSKLCPICATARTRPRYTLRRTPTAKPREA